MDQHVLWVGMHERDRLGVLRCEHRRGDGAVKDVLRMPMAGAVIVCCFDDRASYRGVGNGVVMMRVVTVRFDAVVIMIIIVIVIMILTVIVAVEVDVQVIAAGVVVEIQSGVRCRNRRREQCQGQRGPLSQSRTHSLHCRCAVS